MAPPGARISKVTQSLAKCLWLQDARCHTLMEFKFEMLLSTTGTIGRFEILEYDALGSLGAEFINHSFLVAFGHPARQDRHSRATAEDLQNFVAFPVRVAAQVRAL